MDNTICLFIMRTEVALQLGLCGLCLALALLGEGVYVYFLLHLSLNIIRIMFQSLTMDLNILDRVQCI